MTMKYKSIDNLTIVEVECDECGVIWLYADNGMWSPNADEMACCPFCCEPAYVPKEER